MSATTAKRRQAGAIEVAARRLPLKRGEKRLVLLALARFLDEGRNDPSVREISRRARVHRMAVVLKLDKLARDGLIELHRGDDARSQRSTYRALLIPDPAPNPQQEGPTMTTTTDTTEAVAEREPLLPSEPKTLRVPRWQRSGYLPGPTQRISWPALDAARERHEQAAEALRSAREDGDAEAEAEALNEVADAVIAADTELRESVDAAGAQFDVLRAEVHPDRAIQDGEGAANAARIAELRGPIEADQAVFRRVSMGLLESDTFESERGDRIRPAAVVEAMRVRGLIK